MQKCAEQNTNIKEGNYYSFVTRVSRSSDHQTEGCLREVVSYKCLKFKNGWRDASSYWLLRKTCFRGGISLPAQL